MKLRRFTDDGVEAFRDHLKQFRSKPTTEFNGDLLEHSGLTEVVEPEINVAQEHFLNKGQAATYLDSVLKKLDPETVATDSGMWTWLAGFFIDSVCPIVDGQRNVKNDYYYIYEPKNMRHFYRHLLFVSWQILRLAPNHNRLFLRTRVDSLDGFTTEVMKRLYLTRIPCIFEVLERLYWDGENGRQRPGMTGNKPVSGNLRHRLPRRIAQLEKTYDLMSLDADQLIELLGDEFSFAQSAQPSLFAT